jgi:Domain of unknown function (DUF4272)
LNPPDAATVFARAAALKSQVLIGLATPPPEILASMMESWDRQERSKFIDDARRRMKGTEAALRAAGVWSQMTKAEQMVVRTLPTELDSRTHINLSWSMESLECLLWALGYVPSLLPYDAQATVDHLGLLPNLESVGSQGTRLIDRREIERARDVAELWHWRSRTRQLQESATEVHLANGMTLDGVVRMAASRAAECGDIPASVDDDFPAFGRAYRDITDEEWAQMTSISIERHRALNWLCGYAPKNRWDETPTDT